MEEDLMDIHTMGSYGQTFIICEYAERLLKSLSEIKGGKDEEQQGRSRKVDTVIIWNTHLPQFIDLCVV